MSKNDQLDLWGTEDDFQWKDFRAAREYVHSLSLKDFVEWESLLEGERLRDEGIPSDPEKIYKHLGWKGWDDWLGILKKDSEPAAPGDLKELFRKDLFSSRIESKWRNFYQARELVRKYGFEYEEEWRLLINNRFPKREALPEDIPVNPEKVYRFHGWIGWKDWLISPEKMVRYTEFPGAREFARSARLSDKAEWRAFLTEESELINQYKMVLPARPHLEYKDSGWADWEDWLGINVGFVDFHSTRKFVHSLKLRNQQEWFRFCSGGFPNKPVRSEKIFTYPDVSYRHEGWMGWGDWLGNR